MKCVSWNVNGLRSIISKGLNEYLEQESADLVCLQEIKAEADQVTDWQLPCGYTAYWNPARRKGYSGTLVLARLPAVLHATGIGEPEGDPEGRVLVLDLGGFFLVNVYTPNAKSDLARLDYRTRVWDPAFRHFCSALAASKPVVVCGDLNVAHQPIDLARPADNRRSAGFTDAEREQFGRHLAAGFADTYRELHPQSVQYSWWSYRAGARARNVGWRIDYCCVTQDLLPRVRDAFIRTSIPGSDHCPVGVVLDL